MRRLLALPLALLPLAAAASAGDAGDVRERVGALALCGVAEPALFEEARAASARCTRIPTACERADAALDLASARAAHTALARAAGTLGVVHAEPPPAADVPIAHEAEASRASLEARLADGASPPLEGDARVDAEAAFSRRVEEVHLLRGVAAIERALAARTPTEPARSPLDLARDEARRAARRAAEDEDAYRARRR